MEKYRQIIMERSVPEPNSGCWLWTGSYFPNGYGQVKMVKQGMGAHRLSWMAFKGEIPDGLHVCHKCDNKGCVNPDHLFLGTHKENMEDRSKKGRTFRHYGELQGAHKLSESDVRIILAEPKPLSTVRAKELGARFGVGAAHIYRIRSGSRWAHMPR